ncbi:MAG: hypothetical protein IJ777_00810 [Clostridia bacterium]|nr:hypothetical protein [Clostridia bacterium]
MKKINLKLISKKWLILAMIAILLIVGMILYFSFKKDNKNLNLGNNIGNKSIQEIEEYILNISSYEATIDVTIQSNKNETKYQLKQNFSAPNIEKQVVLQPSNIAGLETIYDGNHLTINNTKLNASTVYKNYPYVMNNYLWLNSFIQEYQELKQTVNATKLSEENDIVCMEVNLEGISPYISHKKLLIDKKTGNITKLIIQDKNKKNIVYILYNEIKINSLKKEEVLAFKNILASQLH